MKRSIPRHFGRGAYPVRRVGCALMLSVLVFFSVSCKPLLNYQPPGNRSSGLLKNPITSDTVTMDVLIVNVPYQERELLEQLWAQVDEQELPSEIRRELAGNGFRAGILGASIPESLAKLMALKGKGVRKEWEETVTTPNDASVPRSLSKVQTIQPGSRSPISISDEPIPKMTILSTEGRELTGRTFYDALPYLSLLVRPESDGSVTFEVTPFLKLGEPQMVSKYKYGRMIRSFEEQTKTFDSLRFSLGLRPGQFLVFGPQSPEKSGLGHNFFTRGSGDADQKIVVVRLLATQSDPRFDTFPGFDEMAAKSKTPDWNSWEKKRLSGSEPVEEPFSDVRMN